MRLTCLRCGHQTELATAPAGMRVACTCGQEYSYPEVYNTGIRPSERAAERSRSRAFRAAGLVKNVGGFAFGLAALGILFFPLGLAGAALGIYVLTMLRGPVGRYSGRHAAMGAVPLGIIVFALWTGVIYSEVEKRSQRRIDTLQQSASEDLRALLRAERLFRAVSDTYGTFKELRYKPTHGAYTLYLGPDDYLAGRRGDAIVADPLPPDLQPSVSEATFTAVAVANLDDDSDLDVWVLQHTGEVQHVQDDDAREE